jgi:hypothetical protein
MAVPRWIPGHGLVGRDVQLELIGSQLAGLDESRGALVLLSGEPGIGKTRLAEETLGRARALGARTAWTTAWQGEGAPPLWPWADILRQLVGSDHALADFSAESPGESAAAQFGQAAAVAEVIRRIASRERLLVVMEDLQWADAASVRVLLFVASATRDVSCMLLATFRGEELDRQHVAELTRAGTSVAVPRLSPDAAGELLRASVGSGMSTSAVDAVVERSGGNPLFVWEFGQLMGSSGRLDVAPAAVPTAVAAVVERRLARLSEEVVAVLRAAAVAGKSFSADVVAAVSGFPADQVAADLETAVGAAIVVRIDHDAFAFSHDVVRDVVLDGLEPARRAALHERAAAVFAQRLPGDPAFHAAVADHLERAGPEHADAASVHWERAARRALDVVAYREAAGLFGRAARAASSHPARRAALSVDEGDALLLAGDLDAARARFGTGADLARQVAAPHLFARAVLGIGAGPVAWEVPIASGDQARLVADALAALPDDAAELRSMLLARLSVTAATPRRWSWPASAPQRRSTWPRRWATSALSPRLSPRSTTPTVARPTRRCAGTTPTPSWSWPRPPTIGCWPCSVTGFGSSPTWSSAIWPASTAPSPRSPGWPVNCATPSWTGTCRCSVGCERCWRAMSRPRRATSTTSPRRRRRPAAPTRR